MRVLYLHAIAKLVRKDKVAPLHARLVVCLDTAQGEGGLGVVVVCEKKGGKVVLFPWRERWGGMGGGHTCAGTSLGRRWPISELYVAAMCASSSGRLGMRGNWSSRLCCGEYRVGFREGVFVAVSLQ